MNWSRHMRPNPHHLSQVEAFDSVTKRYLWPPGVNATGRRILYTGPDGRTDQKVDVQEDTHYVGIGTMSKEGTSDLQYLYRPERKNAPEILPKHQRVGAIGWGIPAYTDWSYPLSNHQLRRGEFRKSAEDRHTHLYQNPWMAKMPPKTPKFTVPAQTYMTVNRLSSIPNNFISES